MSKRFIFAETKEAYLRHSENIKPDSVVFVKDTKEIITQGVVFDCNKYIPSTPSEDPTNTGWIDFVYPVGSVYISINNTNPSILFGVGVWESIEDRFLLSSGSRNGGEMGGEETHTLTEEELAPHHHHHTPPMLTADEDEANGFTVGQATNKQYTKIASIEESDEAGGGQPHNNMPPYLVVYMWKRIS